MADLDFTQRLKEIETRDSNLKSLQVKYQERKRQLNVTLKELKAEVKELIGTSSIDKLEAKITSLQEEIDTQMTEFETALSVYDDTETDDEDFD